VAAALQLSRKGCNEKPAEIKGGRGSPGRLKRTNLDAGHRTALGEVTPGARGLRLAAGDEVRVVENRTPEVSLIRVRDIGMPHTHVGASPPCFMAQVIYA
jgi:hypothetical protein